jgi:di/tricarboxylate transporter
LEQERNVMENDTIFVFGVVVVSAVLFASNRVRFDVVALLAALALMLSGVLTVGEALAGFGDPVVLLVACLLVVGEVLDRTGVVQSVGAWILRVGAGNESRLLVLIMVSAALLSSVMSSTAVVAIFIPIVLKVAAQTGLNPARMLMPMAFAAMISGTLTLIATPPNLVLSYELETAGFEPLGFFSFFPIGAVILVLGVVYILLVGRRLLAKKEVAGAKSSRRTLPDLWEAYGLRARVHRVGVPATSPLAGAIIGEAGVESRYQVRILALERPAGRREAARVVPASSHDRMRAGDTLLVLADPEAIAAFSGAEQLDASTHTERDRQRMLREYGAGVAMVHPDCQFVGRSLREIDFHERYGLQVIGIRRGGKLLDDFSSASLAVADTLLVAGKWSRIAKLRDEAHDFVLLELAAEHDEARPAHRKAPVAIAIVVGMVLLSVFNVVPIVAAALMAVLAIVFTRCLPMEGAYQAISWSSLVLLAGMLPVATALERTGGTDVVVGGLVAGVGSAGPYAMMTVLFFVTAGLSLFLSNTATAVLMAPVAIQTAGALGVSPRTFAVVVLVAASSAFATPIASAVVTLVVEPGRYRFFDFVKVGAPLMLLAYLAAILVVPIVFPLS